MFKVIVTGAMISLFITASYAETIDRDNSKWYVGFETGASVLSGTSYKEYDAGGAETDTQTWADSSTIGYDFSANIGYLFNQHFSLELGVTYNSNNQDEKIPGDYFVTTDSPYQSILSSLSAKYMFNSFSFEPKISPFISLGVGWESYMGGLSDHSDDPALLASLGASYHLNTKTDIVFDYQFVDVLGSRKESLIPNSSGSDFYTPNKNFFNIGIRRSVF